MRKLPLVTPRADVEIRGVYGQPVFDLYEQMRRLVVQQSGNRAVGDFFAEPQLNRARGEIAWYTAATGPIQPVTELSPEMQQRLWQQLDVQREQIVSIAERYIASGGHAAATRADTFRAMLTITDMTRCLFSVGGRPVLAEWGCTLCAGDNRSVDLWTAGAARPAMIVHPNEDELRIDSAFTSTVPSTPEIQQTSSPLHEEAQGPRPIKPDELAEAEAAPVQKAAYRPRAAASERVITTAAAPHLLSSNDNARRPTGGGAPYAARGRFDRVWDVLKYGILLLLGLLLIACVLRACGAASGGLTDPASTEEKQLRAEIAALRLQAGQIALHCTEPGTRP